MSENEQNKPFVINDRRKFRMDGEPVEPRPETPTEQIAEPVASPVAEATPAVEETPAASKPAPIPFPVRETAAPAPEPVEEVAAPEEPVAAAEDEEGKLPPPTPEEVEQVRAAYEATAERIETMMRSQNLGAEHMPPMDFTQLVQSLYMSAMMQLGAGTQQGQQARVDLLGAKNSIEMLAVVEEKTVGSLTEQEQRLLQSALFELRMGFLEITQLLARQAQARQSTPPPPGAPSGGGFPGGGGFSGGGGFGGGGFSGGGPKIVR